MITFKRDRSKGNFPHPHKPRYVSTNMQEFKKTHNGRVKLVSYNLRFGQRVSKAIELFKKHKELANADIICLQEMHPKGMEQFAKELGYNYIYYPASRHTHHGLEFGNGILSKWPIVKDKKIILPVNCDKDMQRIAVQAILQINNKRVLVFSVHLHVFMRISTRKKQMFSLLHAIPEGIDHCIIAGDFNTFSKKSRKAISDVLSHEHFSIASNDLNWTFHNWFIATHKSLLDHIFIRGMETVESGKIANKKPSDHIPIWAVLKFKAKKKKTIKKRPAKKKRAS